MILYSALYQSHDPFGLFSNVVACVSPKEMSSGGVLLLHGGEDISPSIYGEKANSKCFAPNSPSKRDRRELAFIDRAVQLGMPIIGICRGAQLLCAVAGGKLVQDVAGHEWGKHDLYDKDGFVTLTNSIHHQMMRPMNTKHNILSWCEPKLSDKYLIENDEEISMEIEPEIVYFEELKALAIQGHPEYLKHDNPFVQYCNKHVKEQLHVL